MPIQHSPQSDDEHGRDVTLSLGRLRSQLKRGGPEVRYPLLIAFVDGKLTSAADRQLVEQSVGCWRAWFDAYWEVWITAHDGNAGEREQNLSEQPDSLAGQPSSALPSRISVAVRRLSLTAATVAILSVTATVSYGIWVWASKPLLEDRFENKWIDSRLWKFPPYEIKGGGVVPGKDHVRLINRGYLITQAEFREPISLRFDWKWVHDGRLNQSYADHLTVALHTTGQPDPRRPHEVLDGLVIKFNAGTGSISIRSLAAPELYASTKTAAVPFPANEVHSIRIEDTGTKVSIYVTPRIAGQTLPGHDLDVPVLDFAYQFKADRHHCVLYNRELVGISHGVIAQESQIDNVVIERRPR